MVVEHQRRSRLIEQFREFHRAIKWPALMLLHSLNDEQCVNFPISNNNQTTRQRTRKWDSRTQEINYHTIHRPLLSLVELVRWTNYFVATFTSTNHSEGTIPSGRQSHFSGFDNHTTESRGFAAAMPGRLAPWTTIIIVIMIIKSPSSLPTPLPRNHYPAQLRRRRHGTEIPVMLALAEREAILVARHRLVVRLIDRRRSDNEKIVYLQVNHSLSLGRWNSLLFPGEDRKNNKHHGKRTIKAQPTGT